MRHNAPTLLIWALLLLSSVNLHAQIVVVVNSTNPTVSLSAIELRRIYLGDVTNWEKERGEGTDIILLDHRPRTQIATQFYKKVVGLSQSRIRLEWIGKLLNGRFHKLPVKLDSDTDVLA